MAKVPRCLYVSATPARFEIENSRVGNSEYIPSVKKKKQGRSRGTLVPPARLPRISGSAQPVEEFDVETRGKDLIVEQIIRPTGLLDPVIRLRPLTGQIDETIELCRQRVEIEQRVLITTLTKRTAEDLTDYLRGVNLKVRYMHADIDAVERVEILRALRAAEFDILVGINLLREGLDLPEVSLVCILDADKEGYLRSATSLIQTAGRAARHIDGEVYLFADQVTGSMQQLLDITEYRRSRQMEHNEKYGITPRSVIRPVQESLQSGYTASGSTTASSVVAEAGEDFDISEVIREMQGEMQEAAARLEYEKAALLRDQIEELKKHEGQEKPPSNF